VNQQPIYPARAEVKPGMVTTIGVFTLVNGILNILWSAGVTISIVIGTIGVGLLCAPVTILPLVLGIFEIIYGTRLLSTPPQPTKPSQTVAVLEICCILVGNVVSLAVGILALVFYGQPEVRDYFARLNMPVSSQ
jgi:hypothetical protein